MLYGTGRPALPEGGSVMKREIPVFSSRFAPDMYGMLAYKEALGYKTASYSARLLCLDRFCSDKFTDSEQLTQEIAFAWCMAGRKEGMAADRMHLVRDFGKYLTAIGKNAYVLPTTLIPKRKPDLPYILTDYELKSFFAAADNYPHQDNSPLIEFTVPVIFRLIYACGMRPQEARRLKRSDMDYRKNVIYIEESKWCKDRRLAVTPTVMDLCRRYDAIAHSMFPDRVFFFPNQYGEMNSQKWLTRTFHKCWSLSGIGDARGVCVPYDLRHNFATRTMMRWISEGKNLEAYIPY